MCESRENRSNVAVKLLVATVLNVCRMTNISDGQRKYYCLLQSVMCGVTGFSTTDRVLSATGKYHGNVGIYLPKCTVLQPKKIAMSLIFMFIPSV